jgi:MFS family permease
LWATRALRGFADGAVSVLLASHLSKLGFSPLEVGAIVTGTLLGSAALTLAVGLSAARRSGRSLLIASSILMLVTGLGFFAFTRFGPLLVVAVAGTLNPSSGDVSVFLPTEQALLSETVSPKDRTSAFAYYNLAGNFAGALGALASGLPRASQWGFVLYSAVAIAVAFIYRGLSTSAPAERQKAPRAPLARSRNVVLRLALLFCIDSFGGGFVVQSLLALWLFRRFDLSPGAAGAAFFAMSTLSALSQLASSRLAARIGLIQTMVYTHLPANLFLVAAAFMPNAASVIAMLMLRMTLSQMDVPARQSYVMSVVPPEERTAAASVTNVPRSLAAAAAPLAAGALLTHSTFGWPLVFGGVIKIVYDLLLLAQFRRVPTLET